MMQFEEIKRLKKLTEYLYKTQKHKEFVLNKMLETNRIMKKDNKNEIKVAVSKAKARAKHKAEARSKKIAISKSSRLLYDNEGYSDIIKTRLASISNFIQSNLKFGPTQESNQPKKSMKKLFGFLKKVENKKDHLTSQVKRSNSSSRNISRKNRKMKTMKLSGIKSFSNKKKAKDNIQNDLSLQKFPHDLNSGDKDRIPIAKDCSFSAIFFKDIFKKFHYSQSVFGNDKIDLSLQKNQSYHHLRDLTKNEGKFLETLGGMDLVSKLHARDNIIHICVYLNDLLLSRKKPLI